MLSGGVIYVIGMLVMLSANGAASLTVSGGLVGIALACTASSLAMTAAARAVSPERRSVVLGAVGACSSIGTLLIAPSLQFLLAGWHWQIGVVFFLILAAAMLPAAFMAGAVDHIPYPAEKRATMREVVGQAFRSRRYLVMTGAYFVCGLQLIFLTTHLPNYLAICGQDPMLSATALATIGGVNIFGSWSAGWLGGRYPKYILLGLLYLCRSIGTGLVLHDAADAHHHDRFRRCHGHVVVGRDPIGFRLHRRIVRHALHGHHPGNLVRGASDGIGIGSLGRRAAVRRVRIV